MTSAPYLFVIDTTDYAGNFERELCAYVTGRVGGCDVGEDMAALFKAETGQEPFENVMEGANEDGWMRPVDLYPTPKGGNNSVAILFARKPTKAQIALMKARAVQFAALPEHDYGQRPLARRVKRVTGFRLIKQTVKREVVEEIL